MLLAAARRLVVYNVSGMYSGAPASLSQVAHSQPLAGALHDGDGGHDDPPWTRDTHVEAAGSLVVIARAGRVAHFRSGLGYSPPAQPWWPHALVAAGVVLASVYFQCRRKPERRGAGGASQRGSPGKRGSPSRRTSYGGYGGAGHDGGAAPRQQLYEQMQARYSGHGQYGAAADYAAGEDYFDD